MEEADYRRETRRSDGILIGAVFAVFFISVCFVSVGKAIAVDVITIVFLSMFQSRPGAGWSRGAWIVFASLVAVHVVIARSIRVPEAAAGAVYIPFVFADAFVVWQVMKWAEKRFPII